MSSKNIILFFIIGLGTHFLNAEQEKSRAFMQYAEFLDQRPVMQTVITDDLDEFVTEIVQRTNSKPFTVYEYLGFSGAGYENIELYKQDFERAVIQAVKKTKRLYGPSAKVVFLLGGTADGFGIGYQIIAQLLEQKKVSKSNVIVAGLVSDTAVTYHLEGQKKGWGDVLSPYQDVLLLMDVYKKPGQTESWELRKSPLGPSATIEVLHKLFAYRKAQSVTLELFEGGAIAEKEAREFLASRGDAVGSMRMVVRPGYRPRKPQKLSSAPAATALLSDPSLRFTSNIFVQPAGSTKAFEIREFAQMRTMGSHKYPSGIRTPGVG